MGATAAVYSAAILGEFNICCVTRCLRRNIEYLTAEVLELAGNASKDLKVNCLFSFRSKNSRSK